MTGEENGSTGSDTAERRWLVDPLCGTQNYAARSMLAAVNVALRAGRGVAAAACADPFSGEVFWTDGTRACLRSDGADAILAPSPESWLVDVNLDPPFPNAPGFRAASLLADEAFTKRFRRADPATHAELLEMIRTLRPAGDGAPVPVTGFSA